MSSFFRRNEQTNVDNNEDVYNIFHSQHGNTVDEEEQKDNENKELVEGQDLRPRYKFPTWNPFYIFLTAYAFFLFIAFVSYAIYKRANATVYTTQTWRIVLFGDSLWNVPYSEYFLTERMNIMMPGYNLHFINAGEDGNTILDLRNRLFTTCLNHHPDIVLMQWDSDVSNYPIPYLLNNETLQAYYDNVYYVVNTIKNYNVTFFGVTGPILLGEGGLLFVRPSFVGKNDALNLYRSINQNVTSELGVKYINMRQRFQSVIPSWWPFGRYFLTRDGEHPYSRGVNLIAETWTDQLKDWFREYNTSQITPSDVFEDDNYGNKGWGLF